MASMFAARRFHLLTGFVICAALLLDVRIATAREWSSTLEGGGTVTVDPHTRRATVIRDGVQTPLWDGIHRLQDGSTLTIRSGVAVPTEPMIQSPPPVTEDSRLKEWIGAPIVGYSPCERLVRDVCGKTDECATAPGCEPARQLLEMERQERKSATSPNIMTYSSAQCQQAHQDRTLFGLCGQASGNSSQTPATATAGKVVSPCRHLVLRVCGRTNACGNSEACDAARQLVTLEEQERVNSGLKSYQHNPTSGQCRQALAGDAYFQPCRTQ